VRKQSPNGKAERQRVGSGAHLSEGEENDEGEKYLQPSPHVIGEGERGSEWVPQVGVVHQCRAGPVSGQRTLGSPVLGH
jgi:hypothetical protein